MTDSVEVITDGSEPEGLRALCSAYYLQKDRPMSSGTRELCDEVWY